MTLSRYTFAKMEADAIEIDRVSPLMIVFVGHGKVGALFPSIRAKDGVFGKARTARRMANMVAFRML